MDEEDSLGLLERPTRSKPPRRVRRGWESEASVYRDVSFEATGASAVLSASKSVTGNRPAAGPRGSTASKRRKQPTPAQQLHARRRPLSAQYETSNRSAGLQQVRPLRRPQSAGPSRPRSAGPARSAEELAVAPARPQSAGAVRAEASEGARAYSSVAEDGDGEQPVAESQSYSGLRTSPIRTRASRPNSASASIRWLQPLDGRWDGTDYSRTRPASAGGRMEGSSYQRRAWQGYNIYSWRPDYAAEAEASERMLAEESAMAAAAERTARHGAAMRIQCAWCIHLAYRTVFERRQFVTENRAACKLQASARGWLTRKRRHEQIKAAELIQRMWRGHAGRRRAADKAAAAAAALAAMPYVAPPWGAKETEVLMMLCEREGLGSWARKALQLGGRRTAEDLNTRYFWVLRQKNVAEEKKEAEAERVRVHEALVEAEAKTERSRLRKEHAKEKKREPASARFAAGGAGSNGRKAVWQTGDTNNSIVAYKMSEEAKREAAEGAILEVLLRMLKGEKTLCNYTCNPDHVIYGDVSKRFCACRRAKAGLSSGGVQGIGPGRLRAAGRAGADRWYIPSAATTCISLLLREIACDCTRTTT